MTNPYIERAAKVMHAVPTSAGLRERCAEALDSAGLLLTPLHERAMEACEIHAQRMVENGFIPTIGSSSHGCYAIGRESLALKEKAKGAKWVAVKRPVSGDKWAVCRNVTPILFKDAIYKSPGVLGDDFTESQARRVAAALNEGDE